MSNEIVNVSNATPGFLRYPTSAVTKVVRDYAGRAEEFLGDALLRGASFLGETVVPYLVFESEKFEGRIDQRVEGMKLPPALTGRRVSTYPNILQKSLYYPGRGLFR
jgi:hypothetical protein